MVIFTMIPKRLCQNTTAGEARRFACLQPQQSRAYARARFVRTPRPAVERLTRQRHTCLTCRCCCRRRRRPPIYGLAVWTRRSGHARNMHTQAGLPGCVCVILSVAAPRIRAHHHHQPHAPRKPCQGVPRIAQTRRTICQRRRAELGMQPNRKCKSSVQRQHKRQHKTGGRTTGNGGSKSGGGGGDGRKGPDKLHGKIVFLQPVNSREKHTFARALLPVSVGDNEGIFCKNSFTIFYEQYLLTAIETYDFLCHM